jgi:serine/threonine protein kinase
MGRVWLAHDELLDRLVAIKQNVLGDAASREMPGTAWSRELGEARAAARVSHEGVVRIHDVVWDGDCAWIVMEPLSGRTLAEALAAGGPLAVGEVARIGLRLIDALQAIHRAGIVHRDVKPGNVHLCADGRVVLTDFGIAGNAGEECDGPVGAVAGSPAYVSPEQLNGVAPEPASDLFSLGATLFAAVEGVAPFDRGDVFATVVAVMAGAPAPLRRAGPLGPVIAGLLIKEPEGRLTAGQARGVLLVLRERRMGLRGTEHRGRRSSPDLAGR